MKRLMVRCVACAACLMAVSVFVAPVCADWFMGDPYKMHYPQLPDPNGWDVDATTQWIADDWLCTESGPVSDIHLWYSWKNGVPGTLAGVLLKIYSDMPADDPENEVGYSYPDELLWERGFEAPLLTIMAGTGLQGWYDPGEPLVIVEDHELYYQVNIVQIQEPFYQEKGDIYWLAVHFIPEEPGVLAGWKTSKDHWNDDAVYGISGNPPWAELIDPLTLESLDMAFVIVPEPASLVLIVLGGLLFAWRLRRCPA